MSVSIQLRNTNLILARKECANDSNEKAASDPSWDCSVSKTSDESSSLVRAISNHVRLNHVISQSVKNGVDVLRQIYSRLVHVLT